MAEKLDPKEIVTLEELAISSMWEMAALVEVLAKNGLIPVREKERVAQPHCGNGLTQTRATMIGR